MINSNVPWQDDKFVHTRSFTRDITAAKVAEHELRRHACELNDLVIQEVTVAKLAVEMSETDKANNALSRALPRAKEMAFPPPSDIEGDRAR